jgi:Spy/CpxP family protein refolding chaperone
MGNLVQQLINGQETSQKQEISKEKLLEVLTPEQRKQLGLD